MFRIVFSRGSRESGASSPHSCHQIPACASQPPQSGPFATSTTPETRTLNSRAPLHDTAFAVARTGEPAREGDRNSSPKHRQSCSPRCGVPSPTGGVTARLLRRTRQLTPITDGRNVHCNRNIPNAFQKASTLCPTKWRLSHIFSSLPSRSFLLRCWGSQRVPVSNAACPKNSTATIAF